MPAVQTLGSEKDALENLRTARTPRSLAGLHTGAQKFSTAVHQSQTRQWMPRLLGFLVYTALWAGRPGRETAAAQDASGWPAENGRGRWPLVLVVAVGNGSGSEASSPSLLNRIGRQRLSSCSRLLFWKCVTNCALPCTVTCNLVLDPKSCGEMSLSIPSRMTSVQHRLGRSFGHHQAKQEADDGTTRCFGWQWTR